LWTVKALRKDAQVGSLVSKDGSAWTIVLWTDGTGTAYIADPTGQIVSTVRWTWGPPHHLYDARPS